MSWVWFTLGVLVVIAFDMILFVVLAGIATCIDEEDCEETRCIFGVACFSVAAMILLVTGAIIAAVGPIEVALFIYLPAGSLAARLAALDYRRLDALTRRAKAAILAEGGHPRPIAEAA